MSQFASATNHAANPHATMLKVFANIALVMIALPSAARAQFPSVAGEPAGIVDHPCPAPLQPPPELAALEKSGPRAVFESKLPAVVAFLREEDRRRRLDRAGLCRYRSANRDFAERRNAPPAAVFLGDSITDFWPEVDRQFFEANKFVGRGIGAQVTSQGVLRFQQDVVELHPRAVHILYGTNDIAGLAGPTTLKRVEDNLTMMVELARANKIAPILGTVLPVSSLPDGTKVPSLNAHILQLNAWIRSYGRFAHVAVADYYPALSDAAGNFRASLNSDGVHPNAAGYRVMEPIAAAAIAAATRGTAPRRPARLAPAREAGGYDAQ